jgi:hypothetical protein
MSDISTSAYMHTFESLLKARRENGGKLAVERESEFAAELDRLWWECTPEEQDALIQKVTLR